jgi:hypothetical protein
MRRCDESKRRSTRLESAIHGIETQIHPSPQIVDLAPEVVEPPRPISPRHVAALDLEPGPVPLPAA